jgi:hypothetical protein
MDFKSITAIFSPVPVMTILLVKGISQTPLTPEIPKDRVSTVEAEKS